MQTARTDETFLKLLPHGSRVSQFPACSIRFSFPYKIKMLFGPLNRHVSSWLHSIDRTFSNACFDSALSNGERKVSKSAKLISKKFSNRNRASRTAEYLRSKVNRIKCGLSEQYLSNEMLADLETFSTDRCFVPATVPSSTYRSLPTTFACSEKSIFRHPYLLSYSLQFSSTVEARRVSPILKAGTSRHAGGTARRAGNPTLILSF